MSTFYVRYTFSNECELFSDMFQTRTEACDYADYIRDINQNENSRVEVFKQENLLTDYGYKQTYTSNNKFSDNYSDNYYKLVKKRIMWKSKLEKSGAHYVIETLLGLPNIIDEINDTSKPLKKVIRSL